MKKNSFIYGAILLTIVNFFIRFIGFSYDVLLSKLIGAEGIGLFQMTMPVLMMFLMITTAGIPTAVSKLISEYNSKKSYSAIKKVFKISVLFTLILSIMLASILIIFGRYISLRIFKTADMLLCIYFLAPAIIVISLTSVIRGYYYGLKMMGTASISEIVEHTTRFVIILGLLYIYYPVNPLQGALIAICGISIGEVFDLMWLTFVKKRYIKKLPYTIPIRINTASVINRILHIACPLTISGFLNVSLQFVNAILIPHRLMSLGYTNSHAVATFGRIMGMAMPLIYLPYIVTSALVINIIPSLSGQFLLKNYRKVKYDILLSIKITLLISIPLTVLYVFFSKPLAVYLYNDFKASEFIHVMAYSTIFLAMQHTLSGILHGIGKQIDTTIHRLVGMILQLLAIYYLVGNPSFGIHGYFIGFFLCTLTICILDFSALWKMIRIKFKFLDMVVKPFVATAFMIFSVYISKGLLHGIGVNNAISFVYSLITGGFCYIFFLYISKAFPPNLLKKLFSIHE